MIHRSGRSIVIGLALVIAARLTYSQTSTTDPENNLYSTALIASVSEMEKSYGHIDDSIHGSQIRTNYLHMLVMKDQEITQGLPTQFGEHQIEYLDKQAIVAKYKALGKEFSILEIHPMQSDGHTLRIQVSESWASYHKGRLMLAVSDWSDVEFRFDSEKQSFVIASVRLGGV